MEEMVTGQVPREQSKKSNKKLKKIIVLVAASLAGVSMATIASTICVYDSFFSRYERPDYALYPGLYDYERLRDTLPREVVSVPSGDVMLCGYYYPVQSAEGLVVIAHGFHAGADDYLPLTEALVQGGYAVFTYDVTGTYDSGGDSVIGMCQSLCDLDRVLTYLGATQPYADMPVSLIGHSWGGYAVSSVLALHPEVRACICIAPMNNGATIMVEKGKQYVGDLVQAGKPIFDVYQRLLFGDYVEHSGVRGINATQIPVLIAHGVDDKTITVNGQSILAHKEELTNPNVRIYYGYGLQGSHTGIWHSLRSEEYQRQIESELALLEKSKGSALSREEKAAFYERVDHRLYSEVNPELMSHIFATLELGAP